MLFPRLWMLCKKNTDTKNVTCLNGYQFCLKCLKNCYNDNNCQKENDENWKKLKSWKMLKI